MATQTDKAYKIFTPRELEIIGLICREFNTPQIAEKLQLSERTVEGFRAGVLKKIKAKNTAGIVIYAIKNRLFAV